MLPPPHLKAEPASKLDLTLKSDQGLILLSFDCLCGWRFSRRSAPVFDHPHCDYLSNHNFPCCVFHLLPLVLPVVSPRKPWPLGSWEQQLDPSSGWANSVNLLCTPDPLQSWWPSTGLSSVLSVSCTGEPRTGHRVLGTALLMPGTGNNHFPWPIGSS